MDGEVYSARACLSARSCKLCLVMSIIAMVLVLATLIVVLGELLVGGDMCVLCIRYHEDAVEYCAIHGHERCSLVGLALHWSSFP